MLLGDILNVNYGVVSLFGYSMHELLTGNIIKVMCAPYSTHHTVFMQRYFDTGVSGVLNRKRMIFGLHKSGYIIPIEIFIREIASSMVTESIASSDTSQTGAAVSASSSSHNSSTFVAVIKLTELEQVNAGTLQAGVYDEMDAESKTKKRRIAEEVDSTEPTVPEFGALDGHFGISTCTQGFARIFGLDLLELRSGNVKV